MTPAGWIALAGVGLTLASLLVATSRYRADQVSSLAQRVSRLEAQAELWWRSVTVQAAAVLHSPHPQWARRDELLEALQERDLTLDEAVELAGMVAAVRDDHTTTQAEQIAAGQLLAYLAIRHDIQ